MDDSATCRQSGDLVGEVRRLIEQHVEAVASVVGRPMVAEALMPGKMLRTRLAARLAVTAPPGLNLTTLAHVCAAVELVHAASLCHDDVIDNGWIRRSLPAVWRSTGPTGAVLLGDLLLSESLGLLSPVEEGTYVSPFITKIREVCLAEAEQELRWRGRHPDEATCLRLARYKTGPLFAFVGYVCGGNRRALSSVLEEAGYRIGTAYQLTDDLIDITGDERIVGKTLGSDLKHQKFTLPQGDEDTRQHTRVRLRELCTSALSCLRSYPEARRAVGRFLVHDLQPLLDLGHHCMDTLCEEHVT